MSDSGEDVGVEDSQVVDGGDDSIPNSNAGNMSDSELLAESLQAHFVVSASPAALLEVAALTSTNEES